jgi:hypothetical protein
MMVVWIPGKHFNIPNVNQRAKVLCVDPEFESLIVRSCGQPHLVAEVPAEQVLGIEVSDKLTFHFKQPKVAFRS